MNYRDGKAYGRGVQDDKGPTLTAVYAVKALLDEGFTPNYRLRFIFGTDEENLWRGIKVYMEKEEKPDFGFTPDSIFPLIHAEKGVLEYSSMRRTKVVSPLRPVMPITSFPAMSRLLNRRPS